MKLVRNQKILILLLSLFLIPILSSWVADILKAYCNAGQDWGGNLLLKAGAAATAALLLIWWVARIIESFLQPYQITAVRESGKQVVICLLSAQQGEIDVRQAPGGNVLAFDGMDLPKELKNVCAATNLGPAQGRPPFSWQQLLRAIEFHHLKGTLKRVVILGSGGEKGSAKQELKARKVFDYYLPGLSVDFPISQADSPEFESLDMVRQRLLKILDDLNAQGFSDSNIVIDVTGGQKTASIAAVMVTLNRPKLVFEYMGTGDKARELMFFDAQILNSSTG